MPDAHVDKIWDERCFEIDVQFDISVVQDSVKAGLGAIRKAGTHIGRGEAGPEECIDIVVIELSHLKSRK